MIHIWRQRGSALLAALLLAAGSPVCAAAETATDAAGVITAIVNSEMLLDIETVTVPTDDTEPLLLKMLALQYVTAETVSPGGESETLTLRVGWDPDISFAEPGSYTVSASIRVPEGYVFDEGVPQTVSIPVTAVPPVETGPDVAAVFDDFSHSYAFAIPQGCSWDKFFSLQFEDGIWQSSLLCWAADGTPLKEAHIIWENPHPDTTRPGVIVLRGKAALPENTVLADGVSLPEVEVPISIQSQPELDCWYISGGNIILPWVSGGAEDSARVLVSRDGGEWTESSSFFAINAGVYLAVRALEEGSSYRVKAVWDGGETGIFRFDWNGQVGNSGYLGGDRDGGDSAGNPPASIVQPPPENTGSTELEEKPETPEPVRPWRPRPFRPPLPRPSEPEEERQETEPQNPEPVFPSQPPAPENEPFLEQVTDTYSLLSGTRILLMREYGPVRFSKQGVTLTLSDDALDALELTDTSRFYIEIQKTDNGFSLAAELDGKPVTALPGTSVQMLYPMTENTLAVTDADGRTISGGHYLASLSVASFSVHAPGRYTVTEFPSPPPQAETVQSPTKGTVPPDIETNIVPSPVPEPETAVPAGLFSRERETEPAETAPMPSETVPISGTAEPSVPVRSPAAAAREEAGPLTPEEPWKAFPLSLALIPAAAAGALAVWMRRRNNNKNNG